MQVKGKDLRKGDVIVTARNENFTIKKIAKPRGSAYARVELVGYEPMSLEREAFFTVTRGAE